MNLSNLDHKVSLHYLEIFLITFTLLFDLSQNGNIPPDKRLNKSTPTLHMSEAVDA